MLVLVEHPLEVGHALPELYLLPDLALGHDAPHQVLVVVAVHHREGQLVRPRHPHLQLLVELLLGVVVTEVHALRETGGVALLLVGLVLLLLVGDLLGGLLADLEVVEVGVEEGLLLGDEEGDLFGVGRGDLLADEDVGQRLVAVEQAAVVIEQQVLVQLLRQTGRELYLRQQALHHRLLLGVREDTPLLEQIVHLYLLSRPLY